MHISNTEDEEKYDTGYRHTENESKEVEEESMSKHNSLMEKYRSR